MSGWINAVALMETQDTHAFCAILESTISGSDATYWWDEHLLVDLPTIEEEMLFRLAHMNDATVPEMIQLGDHAYLIPSRHAAQVREWIDDGLLEGAAAHITIARIELRSASVLWSLRSAISARSPAFRSTRPLISLVA
jgi:hypothetical protein